MDSKLILAKNIKLDKEYNNVLSYTHSQMLELVQNNSVYESDNLNYLDYLASTIKVNCDYSVAMSSNYLAFKNPRHGDKWYFAFVDDVKYEAPLQTTIYFTIDVWSTFYLDWNYRPCFVVREHVDDDTVGANTVPENVTLGDYVCNEHYKDPKNSVVPHIIVASTVDPHISSGEPPSDVWGGVYNGIPYSYALFDVGGINGLIDFIDALGDQASAIQNVWLAPEWVIGTPLGLNNAVIPTDTPATYGGTRYPITTLDGYAPLNKKLLTYPYCYYLLSNGQNQNAILQPELWATTSLNRMQYAIKGCITPGCSIRCYPLNYGKDATAVSQGVNLGKFPALSWSNDYYTLWQSENALNNTFNAVGAVGSIASGNVVGGAMSIGNLLYSDYRAQRVPPQIHGNTNCGDVMTSMKENCFHFYKMTIKQEYAIQIDNYFKRYGYKVNKIKIPEIKSRVYWNYVEIGQSEEAIMGSLPSKYIDQINNMFRKGITIWHNHDNVGNFNLVNEIVSN